MIHIIVCYATPEKKAQIQLSVEESCTVEMAIKRSKIMEQFSEIKMATIAVGIFGQRVKLSSNLHDGDRIEIYRPLLIDPKDLRRIKARK